MGFGSDTARREYENRVNTEATHRKEREHVAMEHFQTQMPSIIHRIGLKVDDSIRRNGECDYVRLKMRGKDLAPSTWLATSEGAEFLLSELRAYESKISSAHILDLRSLEFSDPTRCYLQVEFSPPIT